MKKTLVLIVLLGVLKLNAAEKSITCFVSLKLEDRISAVFGVLNADFRNVSFDSTSANNDGNPFLAASGSFGGQTLFVIAGGKGNTTNFSIPYDGKGEVNFTSISSGGVLEINCRPSIN